MKLLLALGFLTLALSSCNSGKVTSSNSNSSSSSSSNSSSAHDSASAKNSDSNKNKFVGTWELDNPASLRVDSSTFIFKEDNTFSMQDVRKGEAVNKDTGTYEIRGEQLYFSSGSMSELTKEGFKMSGDNKITIKLDDTNLTYTRH